MAEGAEGATDLRTLLRQHGFSVTAQRLAVLDAVTQRPHSTADEVADVVRAGIGTVSRQTVYDALGAFTERRLLRRFRADGSPARYETRVGDNHHHLICRACGRVADVDCAVGEMPCLTAIEDQGYDIDEAEVIYWGRCPECSASDRVSTTDSNRTHRHPTQPHPTQPHPTQQSAKEQRT